MLSRRVLDSRNRISSILNSLIGVLPVLQFLIPARGSLRAILNLEYCNGGVAVGFTRMVYAPYVLQALGIMRGALSALDIQLLAAYAQAMEFFTSIHQEVDALEQQCLQAMNPPAIIPPVILHVGHGQPQHFHAQPQVAHQAPLAALPLIGVGHHSQYHHAMAPGQVGQAPDAPAQVAEAPGPPQAAQASRPPFP